MEMKTVSTDSLSVESANWFAHGVQGCATPHLSSRYVGDENGIVTGIEHYVTFPMDSDDILALMHEYKIGVQFIEEKWCAGNVEGKYFHRAETISHAVLKSYIHMTSGNTVSVPVLLQGE